MRILKIQMLTSGGSKIMMKYLVSAFDAMICREELGRSRFFPALLQTTPLPPRVRQKHFNGVMLIQAMCCITRQRTLRKDAENSGFQGEFTCAIEWKELETILISYSADWL